MKILYYFYELEGPMYAWQYLHFIEELKEHNIYIETYNPASFINFDQANEALIPYMKKNGPYDLFLSCVDSAKLYRQIVLDIKRELSIPTILICWDNLELPFKQKMIAPVFDLVWLTASGTKFLFDQWGCNTIFQTFAANPKNFQPKPSGKQISSIGFIGTPYGGRANRINYLTSNGFNCNVYSDAIFHEGIQLKKRKIDVKDVAIKSSRYLRFSIGRKVLYSTIVNQFLSKESKLIENEFLSKNHSVSFDEMCRIYSDLALSLNIIELRDTHILKNGIPFNNLRAFEIPMSGGLELTSYNEELASYFENDKEIVLYKDFDEMVEKCRFYLNPAHESLVNKMKIAARKRAEGEHTWYHRFSKILNGL
jgi:spore maturation protein CgeB